MMLDIEDTGVEKLKIPIWGFLLLFFAPSTITIVYLIIETSLDITASAIIALAIMNGSINGVIAWLTIRLDGHSSEALEHLNLIMGEMERLEETLDDANEMVTSFTTDLTDAKDMFSNVGVDLNNLDLEPVADVIEKLKENKTDFNEILDHLKEVDVTSYLNQAKRIDWQKLLDAAEEIMSFIQSKTPQPSLNISPPPLPDLDDETFFRQPLTMDPPKVKRDKLDLPPPIRY